MKRARLSPAEKDAAIKAYYASGLSIKKFCDESSLNYWTFREWLVNGNRATERRKKQVPVPLPVISFVPQSTLQKLTGHRIEFLDGTILHLDPSISLDSIISVLRGAK